MTPDASLPPADRTDEDRAEVRCACGWSVKYTPPLVASQPHQGINGRSFISLHDAAGKPVRHSCEQFSLTGPGFGSI